MLTEEAAVALGVDINAGVEALKDRYKQISSCWVQEKLVRFYINFVLHFC